jgi:hypothetical protein
MAAVAAENKETIMMRWVSLVALVLSALLSQGQTSGPAPADARAPAAMAPGRLSLKTDRVVVFKDGYALIVKSAVGTPDGEGRVHTDEVPDAAVLGCFWAFSEDRPIGAIRAEWLEATEERSRETSCVTMVELLRANKGKRVVLGLHRPKDDESTLTGTIVEVLEMPPERTAPAPGAAGEASASDPFAARFGPPSPPRAPVDAPRELVRPLIPTSADFVVFDLEGGQRLVLPIAEVRTIRAESVTTRTERREEVTRRTKRMTFELAPAARRAAGEPVTLTIMYFTPGIRWIPTYRVSGEIQDDADLSLQAEILNELEDIDGAALDLVVGVPNFRFKNVISPMSLERELRNVLAIAAPQLMNRAQQFSNVMFQQRASEYTAEAPAGQGGFGIAPELAAPGSGEQDLFVYNLAGSSGSAMEKFALKKGARATVPLWSSTVPVRHLYTLELAVTRNPRAPGRGYQVFSKRDVQQEGAPSAESPLKLAANFVWHQLELKNSTTVPWTTGAALLLRGFIPLGQDLLTYTPPGSCTLLPVTVAVDVQGAYKEEEIERKPNALRWDDNSYTMIRKRATITLTNHKDKPAESRVSLSLGGRVEEAGDGGRILINDYRTDAWGDGADYRPNNHSDVAWDLTVEPGKTRTLTVEFVFYVR